jgi:hypothetical protein
MKLVRPGIVVTSLALAVAVPLGAGAAASSSGVHPTTGTITGVVDNSHGAPLAGVCVTAWDSALDSAGTTQSISTGAFTLTNISPGVYSVVFDTCGGSSLHPDVQAQDYDNTQAFGSRTFVTVVAGQATQLNTQTMQPGGDITIQVTDSHGAYIPNLRVSVMPAAAEGPNFLMPEGSPTNTADGSIGWHFNDLFPIHYVITYMDCPPAASCVNVGSYHGQAWNSTTPTLVLGIPGSTVALTDTLTLPSVATTVTTETASPNQTTAGQPVTLTATVTTSDGSVPTGSVDFETSSQDFGHVQVGSNGTASVTTTTIPVGSWTIYAAFTGTGLDTSSGVNASVTISAAPAGGGSGAGGSSGSSSGGSSSGGGAAAPVVTAAPVTRVAGTDRIATAVAVSQSSFPTGNAGAVVLARADDYPDALVGGPLAAAKNAPLLLTEGSALPAATATEVKRVLPAGGKVYVLGGTSAVPTSVTSQLTSIGYSVVRYSGADRYATAVAVATALGSPTTVLLATGTNFPDALAAGPAAAHVHGAILLTDGSAVPAETATYLAGAHTTYAIGGPAAAAVPSATAILGSDRYATAAAVATKFFPTSAILGVATGTGFPDALAGGAQLALMGGPLLLASAATVPTSTSNYLTADHSVLTTIYVYGGTAVLGIGVVGQLTAAFGS